MSDRIQKLRSKQPANVKVPPMIPHTRAAAPAEPKPDKVKVIRHLLVGAGSGSVPETSLCGVLRDGETLVGDVGLVTCQKCHDLRPKKPKGPKPSQAMKNDQRLNKKGRLPDGARFELDYDGKAERWTGKLTIGGTVFEDDSSALFKCLIKLDNQFRDWADKQPTE